MGLEIEFTGPPSRDMMTELIGDPLAPAKPQGKAKPADKPKPKPKLKPKQKGKRGKR